jgi:hypothetical protein
MGVSITYPSPDEAGVSVTYHLPNTGFCNCTEDDARKLMRIVDAGCPWLALNATTGLSEFGRAFTAVGLMFRTAEPVSKYAAGHFLDAANAMLLERLGSCSVGGVAFVGAVFAHGDIRYRLANPKLGQMLEIGLDQYHGRQCENSWRGLLTGERNLLPPTAPRADRAQLAEKSTVSFHKQQPDGSYRRIADNEPLWSRN